MRIFDFFRKKSKQRHRQNPNSSSQQNTAKIQADIDGLKNQAAVMSIAIKKHNDELAEHARIIGQHSKVLEDLEEKVSAVRAAPPAKGSVSVVRPIEVTNPSTEPSPKNNDPAQKLDFNRFSQQEKRILAVFFQNRQMTLSYVDIARALNKSPYTVKNQIRQMRLKADLFDRTVGDQSRNRFKLKDGLRIEKYLNLT